MFLYVVRHGETALNTQDRLRGWVNTPLTAKGKEQAEWLGRFFETRPIQRIYCSDLKPAYLTADILGERIGMVPFASPAFRTVNFGDLNGAKMDKAETEIKKWIKIWGEDPSRAIDNGDSFMSFQNRNLTGVREVIADRESGKDAIIVMHGRNCMLLKQFAKNDSQPIRGDQIEVLLHIDQEPGEAAKYFYNEETGRLLYLRVVNRPDYLTADIVR